MRCATPMVLLALLLPLAACGDDPAPPPPGPIDGEVWHYSPVGLRALLDKRDPGGLAWLPPEVLDGPGDEGAARIAAAFEVVKQSLVGRLILDDDGRFLLKLRQQRQDGWRTVDATGTWTEADGGGLTLVVKTRESKSIAPLEIEDTLVVRRDDAWLLLDTLGRTIPLIRMAAVR